MKKYIYLALVMFSSLTVSASNFLNTNKVKDTIFEYDLLTKVNCAKVALDVKKAMLDQGFSSFDANAVALSAEVSCNLTQ